MEPLQKQLQEIPWASTPCSSARSRLGKHWGSLLYWEALGFLAVLVRALPLPTLTEHLPLWVEPLCRG